VAPALVQAQTVTAMWDPSPPADQVTSYQVCVGTSSRACNTHQASVSASRTSFTFTPAGGVLQYVGVRAVNASGAGAYSSEVSFSIPSFTQPPNRTTAAGSAIAPMTLSVADPDGSPLRFTHTGLPLGLSLDQTTGRISGTPTAAGTYNVTVFVTDGLVTVSRSFVWSVGGSPASDTTPPALSITSHTSGQSVGSIVTLSGTATDNGSGGSGISTVRVNGQVANGGTATGNGTATWSRALTLVNASTTITVEAYDGAGNIQMRQITLHLATSPASPVQPPPPESSLPPSNASPLVITDLASNRVSPQPAGTRSAIRGSSSRPRSPWNRGGRRRR
jgi:hypothetical protein